MCGSRSAPTYLSIDRGGMCTSRMAQRLTELRERSAMPRAMGMVSTCECVFALILPWWALADLTAALLTRGCLCVGARVHFHEPFSSSGSPFVALWTRSNRRTNERARSRRGSFVSALPLFPLFATVLASCASVRARARSFTRSRGSAHGSWCRSRGTLCACA